MVRLAVGWWLSGQLLVCVRQLPSSRSPAGGLGPDPFRPVGPRPSLAILRLLVVLGWLLVELLSPARRCCRWPVRYPVGILALTAAWF